VLGHKKVLLQTSLDQHRLFEESSFNFNGVPGWPKPVAGPWQLRTVWVIEERTLPSNSGYCYGSRVSYLDAEQFQTAARDVYDHELRLWKVFNAGFAPGPLNDGHGSLVMQANSRSMTLDLVNNHATASIQVGPGRVNTQVPEKYRDPQVWALPSGLPQMNP
jgi:hypothetical protein